MKKKLVCLAATLLCMTLLCTPAFAAKPSVEVMHISGYSAWDGKTHGSPTLYYRNNTQKTVDFLDFYLTAYDAAGNPVPDLYTGRATMELTVLGPIEPFQLIRENNSQLYVDENMPEDSPFRFYRDAGYAIDLDGQLLLVYQDANDHFFVCTDPEEERTHIYLTEDQIQNALIEDYVDFEDVVWHNPAIAYVAPEKMVVTYTDGSVETITEMKDPAPRSQDIPFVLKTEPWKPVYNYADYLKYNPDLAAQFGTDQKCLFEHFMASGMAEGRRASAGFDLETYKTQNPDLAAQFGADNAKYYQHYTQNGQREGRAAA